MDEYDDTLASIADLNEAISYLVNAGVKTRVAAGMDLEDALKETGAEVEAWMRLALAEAIDDLSAEGAAAG